MKERTFVMIKPDAVKRKLIGRIIQRFEDKGLDIVKMKMLKIPRELAEKLYEEHRDKDFFEELVDFITSHRVVAMVIEGEEAISVVRKMIGKTNPLEADMGTIRGDFGYSVPDNLVHASDSEENAKREIQLFFGEY
ncbi:MAG TPA: nucleoside-diphosphate kinase [Methanothermococcus okinawensis]|uniref:Nucleoside diphosphate kinase n=1 Tax=Methanothermococcus okinawensis TaxID=155863 RepID=A0A832ZK89_9EURY|nr:nucleoside-diphosphate kinase [Methanococcaceae archaeon]HIP84535.1 nucleoside-diphosphate kinase [Methanothermococcus okinawensis]HIP91783.1 nucleoside-diphosphate kinase [Methanothermococcus okinawensis]